MRKSVEDLMSVDFVVVSASTPLPEALAILVESDATELCVVDASDRLEGVATDYALLKAHLAGRMSNQGISVSTCLSRALVIIAPDVDIEQTLPLFRDGVCSKAYVCRAGRLLGQLSRAAVLRYLSERQVVQASPTVPLHYVATGGRTTTVQPREDSLRGPRFANSPAAERAATSVLGGVCSAIG